MSQNLEFIKSVLMEYHKDKTVDEMWNYYEFNQLFKENTIFSQKTNILEFLINPTDKIYPSDKVTLFDDKRPIIASSLVFNAGGTKKEFNIGIFPERSEYQEFKDAYNQFQLFKTFNKN